MKAEGGGTQGIASALTPETSSPKAQAMRANQTSEPLPPVTEMETGSAEDNQMQRYCKQTRGSITAQDM